jgi:CsoR family transcriptional regulator, copper-sensing transcriptional repressor
LRKKLEHIAATPKEHEMSAAHDHHHHDGDDHHEHDHQDSIRRLKTAEGHLRGIQRMLEDDAYCIDVIQQIQAVQSALNRVSSTILSQHLNSCVITAIRGEDQDERERVLKEITQVFEAANKGSR